MNIRRMLAKWTYQRQAKMAIEKDRIMEEFVTRNIFDGGSEEFISKQRQMLLHLQGEIKAKQLLLDFLKKLKI
jgi:hypothetical protein